MKKLKYLKDFEKVVEKKSTSFSTAVSNDFIDVNDFNFEILDWLNRLFSVDETDAKTFNNLKNS